MKSRDVVVEVDGKKLTLTNLEKPIYPKANYTKAQVIDYYRRIAPALIPHLADRPLTMKRYPHGVESEPFYEKQCPDFAPEWVRKLDVPSESRGEPIGFCVVDDLPTLMWVANLLSLELHSYLFTSRHLERPTAVVFDLDPGPDVTITDCARVALRVRGLLNALDLECFAKTSGSKGMQVYTPLAPGPDFEDSKTFARLVGEALERETPRLVTTNMSKAQREGRVFIDWSQNSAHKTTVSVYSLRALAFPSVSTPLDWKEVKAIAEGDRALARFTPEDVIERFEKRGDLFAPVLTLKQRLPATA